MGEIFKFVYRWKSFVEWWVSKKLLSNDNMSTGLGDKLYFPYILPESNPKRSPILSLWIKLNCRHMKIVLASIVLPKIEKFGLITDG